MTNLQEVPTEELLSFQDYPTVHVSNSATTIPLSEAQINLNADKSYESSPKLQALTDGMNTPGIF